MTDIPTFIETATYGEAVSQGQVAPWHDSDSTEAYSAIREHTENSNPEDPECVKREQELLVAAVGEEHLSRVKRLRKRVKLNHLRILPHPLSDAYDDPEFLANTRVAFGILGLLAENNTRVQVLWYTSMLSEQLIKKCLPTSSLAEEYREGVQAGISTPNYWAIGQEGHQPSRAALWHCGPDPMTLPVIYNHLPAAEKKYIFAWQCLAWSDGLGLGQARRELDEIRPL